MGSRLTFGESVAAVGGFVLFVALFFDWYTAEAGGTANAVSAWQAMTIIDVALLLVALLPVAQAVLRVLGRSPRVPLPLGVIVAAAGLAGVALVLFRIVDLPAGLPGRAPTGPFVGEPGVETGRRIGAVVALVATAGIATGGWAAAAERARWGA